MSDRICLRWDEPRIQILQRLWQNQGIPVSGEEICGQLGLTRTAVWKHVQAMRERGIPIESRNRQGYWISSGSRAYLPEWVVVGRAERQIGRIACFQNEVASTNDLARQMAVEGYEEGTIVFCESQIKGRGRSGKSWFSPAGRSIYVSVILRPSMPLHLAPQLTLMAAVAVANGIRAYPELQRTQIKWPNDILLDGKKLCGILTELVGQPENLEFVIVGIGLNVNGKTEEFPPEVRERAVTMEACAGRTFDRMDVLLRILEELEGAYRLLQAGRFEDIRQQWLTLNGTLGREIVVRQGERQLKGLAESLDESGALMLRLKDGSLCPVVAGEIDLQRG